MAGEGGGWVGGEDRSSREEKGWGSSWSLAEESMYDWGKGEGILAHEQIHVRTNGDLAQMAKRARQCHQEPTK